MPQPGSTHGVTASPSKTTNAETEVILIRHMAQSEWLRARALRLQADCVNNGLAKEDVPKLGVLIRYQTTRERAFHRSLKELQSLRKERRNLEIGFESQKLKQAAEVRATEALRLKKDAQDLQREALEFKKVVFETKNAAPQTKKGASQAVENTPGAQEMAA
jgi:hypothetical protein